MAWGNDGPGPINDRSTTGGCCLVELEPPVKVLTVLSIDVEHEGRGVECQKYFRRRFSDWLSAESDFLPLVLFEDAKNQAKELDEEFARTGSLRGPLHGVPMSFKDQCEYMHEVQYVFVLTICADEIIGYDATIGFTHWANKPSTRPSHVKYQCAIRRIYTFQSLWLSAKKQEPSSLSKPMCLKRCLPSNALMHFGAQPRILGVINIPVEAVLEEF